MSDDTTTEEGDSGEEWVLLLDLGEWNLRDQVRPGGPATVYPKKSRRIERPVLETGFESREAAWEAQAEYAENDDADMGDYRAVRVSRIPDLGFPVDWGEHEKPGGLPESE
jgi:hypothetical protein